MTAAIVGAEGWDGAPRPDDRWHLSASNLSKALASPNLERWGYRTTAERVIEQLPLITQLASTSPDAARELIKEIRWTPPTPGELGAADRGTALHAYLEARVTGAPAAVLNAQHTAQLAPYVAQLEAWLAHFQPEPLEVEQVVYNPEHGLAGRLDFKFRVPRWADMGLTGPDQLVDLKTSDKGFTKFGHVTKPYGDAHPIQLSVYKHATHKATWTPRVCSNSGARFYLANDAELATAVAPVETHGALLLHLTPSHCNAHPVDVSADVYAYARCIASAWRWVHLVSGTAVGACIPTGATA